MQNEKLRILKMLEDGRITSTEAAQLLQSVDMPGGGQHSGHHAPPAPHTPPAPHAPPPPPPAHRPAPAPYDPRSNSPGGRPAPRAGSGMDDLGRRFESFAKDLEPKVSKFAEVVAEKITAGADMLSKAFTADPPAHTAQRSHAPPPVPRPAPSPSGLTEKNIEMGVAAGFNELALSGINGDLRIKGYNGDKITASIAYRAKRAGAEIELMKLGNKYQLNYEPDDFERVVIDAYVPERAFSVIKLDGINTHMDISSLSASDLRITNANGNLRLSNVAATNITAESSAGRFIVSNISAQSAAFENVNGSVEADELDISKLSLTNYNGPLSLLMSTFAQHSDYLWSIETGNAKLNMNLPTLPDLAYHIKAHAAMGEIRLGLTGLQFMINDSTLAEARSTHFDHAAKRVKMTVETSNAPLVIN
ncbi:MAG: DUF4097 domain-containing protein [Defluviitaleaceae bacterium]|nr:DUF4097 domain-containing protein [Defluviitaleaceae bacterium]MCL2238451.1 DUF4097 domain-containing protein [Defluviitaleaceae bacterium]